MCKGLSGSDECCVIVIIRVIRWRSLLSVPWAARRPSQAILKELSLGFLWKEWCWSWSSSTLATSCEELTHWKRPWCWEGLGAGGEGDDRGWDGWMASRTRWTWVWVNSRSWWWTGRPGVLRFMGLQSQTQLSDWTELNWTEIIIRNQITMCYIKWTKDLFLYQRQITVKLISFGVRCWSQRGPWPDVSKSWFQIETNKQGYIERL